jgi:16S rRNA (uracil1498-N3)-methyltransferase
MPRFHCPGSWRAGDLIDLPAGAARHVQVLRLQPGAALTLFGGELADSEFEAVVTRMGRSDVQVQIGKEHRISREAERAVHLAVGMPANERMDWLIEKAAELGVATVQPLITSRSVLRMTGERADKKVAHWQAIAVSACEQCGRNRVPPVRPVRSLHDWLQDERSRTHAYMLSLGEGSLPLAPLTPPGADVTFLSGPEGGLSPEEEAAARALGFQAVSLGPRVLRAETAAIAALAAISLSN